MAGNVAEWVADVYRPVVDDEFNDFNYYRGNVYTKNKIGPDGKTAKIIGENEVEYKTLLNGKKVAVNLPGEISEEPIEEKDTKFRTNYSESYNINFRDGDKRSSRNFGNGEQDEAFNSNSEDTRSMYKSPNLRMDRGYDSSTSTTTLINDQARVYKGGSWKDRAYWMDPAQRKFYPEELSTDFIGFRCAMSRVGAKNGYGTKKRN
tara:strand:- start:477 stop:1091 length:615 start_codon:yes stop_codon:yes gene_type:complete